MKKLTRRLITFHDDTAADRRAVILSKDAEDAIWFLNRMWKNPVVIDKVSDSDPRNDPTITWSWYELHNYSLEVTRWATRQEVLSQEPDPSDKETVYLLIPFGGKVFQFERFTA